MLACIGAFAQANKNQADLDLPEVYRDKNVVFRQIDEHTWIGSGNRVGEESARLKLAKLDSCAPLR